ncbi:hypothetical protein HanXRQr2_Chr06g0268291 [Helianthus annuus]|uniref:Uncharacterized protein n=1 Tax=Helianthus annuus TaxID=4232 RepID=A0A9K3NK30_HELAN|nr:hypothetical protein HanXRQr2_Chr06g0268291 [Helianthus annuus]KAJ0916199.1 hypothetical protein HanPSC8_Chr06g0258931 [Helianthus annuus]
MKKLYLKLPTILFNMNTRKNYTKPITGKKKKKEKKNHNIISKMVSRLR